MKSVVFNNYRPPFLSVAEKSVAINHICCSAVIRFVCLWRYFRLLLGGRERKMKVGVEREKWEVFKVYHTHNNPLHVSLNYLAQLKSVWCEYSPNVKIRLNDHHTNVQIENFSLTFALKCYVYLISSQVFNTSAPSVCFT